MLYWCCQSRRGTQPSSDCITNQPTYLSIPGRSIITLHTKQGGRQTKTDNNKGFLVLARQLVEQDKTQIVGSKSHILS